MLTSTAAAPAPVRPSYRRFDVAVANILRLSDTFTRVTFTGAELHDFGTAGLDQRVKIVLPLPGGGITPFPDHENWYEAWRSLPDDRRNPIRTYTVRAVRPVLNEIDIDFVTHGDAGPASRWVATAAIGDQLAIIGPDAHGENPHSGIEWRPGDARNVLIAGDETAVPAICAILAALPRTARGSAFIEVPHTSDVMETGAPEGVNVTWIARAKAAAEHGSALESHGSALESAVRAWTTRFVSSPHRGVPVADVDIEHDILWDVPAHEADHPAQTHHDQTRGDDLYAWLAGEAGVIKTLRRFLVSETGIDRRQVAFMGYWRNGRSETS